MVDYEKAGLGEYGKVGGYLKRQTKVWTSQFRATEDPEEVREGTSEGGLGAERRVNLKVANFDFDFDLDFDLDILNYNNNSNSIRLPSPPHSSLLTPPSLPQPPPTPPLL